MYSYLSFLWVLTFKNKSLEEIIINTTTKDSPVAFPNVSSQLPFTAFYLGQLREPSPSLKTLHKSRNLTSIYKDVNLKKLGVISK